MFLEFCGHCNLLRDESGMKEEGRTKTKTKLGGVGDRFGDYLFVQSANFPCVGGINHQTYDKNFEA